MLAVAGTESEYALSTILIPGYFFAIAAEKPSRRATFVVAVADESPTTTLYVFPAL